MRIVMAFYAIGLARRITSDPSREALARGWVKPHARALRESKGNQKKNQKGKMGQRTPKRLGHRRSGTIWLVPVDRERGGAQQ